MTPLTTAMLDAVAERARQRNRVRAEVREHSKRGELVTNSQMPSWQAYQRAEAALNAALSAWETEQNLDG